MKVRWISCATLAWLGLTAACTEPSSDPADTEMMVSTTGEVSETSTGAPPPDVGEPAPTLRCATPAGHTGRPQTVAEAIAHIKALPEPVDVPCVLESFARPLEVQATSSVFSAQPGRGDRSPRFFVFFDGLILSFSTTGYGSHLIEFAELTGPTTTIKGEVEFPLDPDELDVSMPFTRIQDDDLGTVCRLCHRNEVPTDDIYPGSFESDALKPQEKTLLELELVREYADACDPSEDAHRCAVYDALFEPGEVVPGEFHPETQTIFDYENE